jgi:NAD-dependent dihydropyrimidine dehydrogenase PreA subunit
MTMPTPSPATRGPYEIRARGRDRRRQTGFIALDTHACDACWECVEACPNEVLGRLSVLFHNHARIVAPDACIGCLKCVKTCEAGALSRRSE